MNITDLFEAPISIKIGRTETPKGVESFMRDFESKTQEHPFTPGMRYFENGPVLIHLAPHGQGVEIRDIQSKAKGAGAGATAMEAIATMADQHGVEVTLTAKGYDQVPTKKLVQYYKRFGFTTLGGNVRDGVEMSRKSS